MQICVICLLATSDNENAVQITKVPVLDTSRKFVFFSVCVFLVIIIIMVTTRKPSLKVAPTTLAMFSSSPMNW